MFESIDSNKDSWLDEIIEEPVNVYPWKELYPALDRRPLRLSHSTLGLLNSCERKFQLLKLKDIQSTIEDREIVFDSKYNNVNLDYGTAFGLGIQEFIITGDIEQAIWKSMLAYNYADERANKNAIGIVAALLAFKDQWNADEWEIAVYNDKPAAELSFKIILDQKTQDYYCGYIDLVLINKVYNTVVVVEIKTTGSKLPDIRPLYQNSGQGLGYSLVLTPILKEHGQVGTWQVLYLVNQLKNQNILPTIHLLPFEKSTKDRLEWLLDLKMDHERIMRNLEIDHWPKRGNSCLAFNRACPLFGICGLEAIDSKEAMIPKEEEWDFVFTLEQLIQEHM